MKRLLPIVLVVAGCGKRATPPPIVKKEEPTRPSTPPLASGPGDTVQYSKGAKREPLWTARWKAVDARFGERGVDSARMTAVEGEMMKDGKPEGTYRADTGRMTKTSEVLALAGNVRVVSGSPAGVLTCDRLEYHPSRRAARAVGRVRFRSREGSLDAGEEIWASSDLRTFGPAELFPVRKAVR